MSAESEVREEARRLLAEILARKRSPLAASAIGDDVSLMRDLGIDSLDILQLAAKLEKHYGIRLSEQETRGLDRFGALVAAVARRRAEG